MNIFPIKNYQFQLRANNPAIWNNLTNETKISESLITVKTDKKFIGQVSNGHFRVISSIPGKGAFCVVEGSIDQNDKTGNLKIEVNKAFRILISIFLILPIVGVITSLFSNGLQETIGLLLIIALFLWGLKFLILKVFFNYASRIGLNDLTSVLGIVELDHIN
ncbi:MAG: hypothetical protein JWQ25_1829 [Daejeonella sp.]|nr:hypothetical protein [Daejeonella sp.]